MILLPPISSLFPYTTLFRSLGYLRHGAKVPVLPDPIINDDCLEGWYELVHGGFVCGRAATLDLKNPRVRLRSEEHTLNSSHTVISYAVFCLKKKKKQRTGQH